VLGLYEFSPGEGMAEGPVGVGDRGQCHFAKISDHKGGKDLPRSNWGEGEMKKLRDVGGLLLSA